MTYSEQIKSARKRLGLSQSALAEMTGVSQPTVANWENGSHMPRSNVADRIRTALNIPLELPLADTPKLTTLGDDFSALSTQVFHVPLIDWPENVSEMGLMPIRRYISIGINAQRPIALPCYDEEMAGCFPSGSLVIVERGMTQIKPGQFGLYDLGDRLVIRKQSELSDTLETAPLHNVPKIEALPEHGQSLGTVILSLREF